MQTTHTLPSSLPEMMLLCPTNTCLNREGKAIAARAAGLHPRWKNQQTQKKNPEKNSWTRCRTDTTPVRAWHVTVWNPFCNLKNLAHYCYCCSLFFMACYILASLVCENKQEKKIFLSPQAKKHQVNALNQQRLMTHPIAELTGFSVAEQTSRLFSQTQRLSCIGIFFIFSSCSPYLDSL